MRPKLVKSSVLILFSALALMICSPLQAQAADMKLEALLLWGTDDAQSPNPKHKPVDAQLKKKLKQLPLKWTNYFEEKRVTFELPQGASKKVALSEHCAIEVKIIDSAKIEVTHYGEGKKVATRTQAMPKGETLVLGGNAPDSTAWLVVLRRIE
ncbi:MAG TPA: hypothetical protein VEC99_04910 [Clostridia bacterium]|nr:hypothetical protein [Clostridia bacterium]